MNSDDETRIDWSSQISIICKRFDAALASGETLAGIDDWLRQVPEEVQPQLKAELHRRQSVFTASSQETLHAGLGGDTRDLPSELLESEIHSPHAAIDDCRTFAGLAHAARRALRSELKPQSFAAGTCLLQQNEAASGLYLLTEGDVRIIDRRNEATIATDSAGSVLGEMSLLTGQPCSAEVVATTNVEALVLSTDSYKRLKDEHPEVEIVLSQLVSDRLGGREHDALCGKTLGGYQLKRCISRGGMGVVYEAQRASDKTPVAIKMLRHRFIYDETVQGRFDQEADLLRSLEHPNIIAMRDHFLAYRTRFLALELCDGSDLFQLIRKHGKLSPAQCMAIIGQIAKGLQYAHDCGVVHRDLKPANVLVGRRGDIKLADFGLSKLIESETSEARAVGTPAYMPPEQFFGGVIGPESDYYALGCLAYEMLTGKMLFEASGWFDVLDKKRSQTPSEDWPPLPVECDLRDLIVTSLHSEPQQRKLDLQEIANWASPVIDLF